MKDAVIDVPSMYADHHVLRVREALLGLSGVSEVRASAARRKILVRFDEAQTSQDAVEDALKAVGYLLGQAPPIGGFPERHKDGSAWNTVAQRATTTEQKDREMAGDFRRY